jgi:signal transduction histidine kinase
MCAAPAIASDAIAGASVIADAFADRADLAQASLRLADDRTAPPGKEYLPYILAGAAAMLLQGLLINWLLRERDQRRRSEAEVRETMSQLARLNRMVTAGELSASIAHELTQPITGMVASANAALRWLSAPTPQIDQARSALARVVSAGDRTREIIHGVRAMFRREAEERRAIDLNEIARGVLALVEGDTERHGIVVETALEEPAIPVLGDRIQLQQVVLNLTVNAIDSMCAIETRPRVLRLRVAYSRDRVWISIADTGVGITRDDINRIFKPLYTTKPNGMGMGLSICASMVEAHKGRIWVAPGEPHGAVFHFVLPTTR